MALKSIKLETGTVYQKHSGGNYYFRYQINGRRKAVSLKTKKQKEAISKAKKLMDVVKADSTEVIAAHVKVAKGLGTRTRSLELALAWSEYEKHPDRATPSTVSEQNAYKGTFKEFVDFIDQPDLLIKDITPEIVSTYADHMRTLEIAVDTHNRKLRRLKKVFDVLSDYRDAPNPFTAKSLRRKEREEQEVMVRRIAFTREEELRVLKVLDDSRYAVMNKPEIRVIYHIAMFTGQRMKDCVLLRWDNVNLRQKKIWVKQFKTGKSVVIPISDKLLNVLHEAQKWKKDQYVCPNVALRYNKTDKNGKNTGNNLVNIDVLRVIKWIGLEPSVKVPGRKKKVTVYGFHSLRHSFVSHCSEAGVPKAVVVSIIGSNSEIIDKYYTHIGEAAQKKAIAIISNQIADEVTDRERIEKTLAYINQLETKIDVVIKIEELLRS